MPDLSIPIGDIINKDFIVKWIESKNDRDIYAFIKNCILGKLTKLFLIEDNYYGKFDPDTYTYSDQRHDHINASIKNDDYMREHVDTDYEYDCSICRYFTDYHYIDMYYTFKNKEVVKKWTCSVHV